MSELHTAPGDLHEAFWKTIRKMQLEGHLTANQLAKCTSVSNLIDWDGFASAVDDASQKAPDA